MTKIVAVFCVFVLKRLWKTDRNKVIPEKCVSSRLEDSFRLEACLGHRWIGPRSGPSRSRLSRFSSRSLFSYLRLSHFRAVHRYASASGKTVRHWIDDYFFITIFIGKGFKYNVEYVTIIVITVRPKVTESFNQMITDSFVGCNLLTLTKICQVN